MGEILSEIVYINILGILQGCLKKRDTYSFSTKPLIVILELLFFFIFICVSSSDDENLKPSISTMISIYFNLTVGKTEQPQNFKNANVNYIFFSDNMKDRMTALAMLC